MTNEKTEKLVDKAHKTFEDIDKNHDGHVTKKELDEAAKSDPKAKKTADKIVNMFQKYDKDGDGTLSRGEMKGILNALNKSLKDIELEYAFMYADRNGDGRVDVEEFVYWVTSSNTSNKDGTTLKAVQADLATEKKELKGPERFFYDKSTYTGVHTKGGPSTVDYHHDKDLRNSKGTDTKRNSAGNAAAASNSKQGPDSNASGAERFAAMTGSMAGGDKQPPPAAATGSTPHERSTDERHKRLAEQAAPTAGADELPWDSVAAKFTKFAGKDMDGSEFNKLCKDCDLIDKKHFKMVDVDSVFAKVVERGKRRINIDQFKDALRLIAAKKGCKVSDIQAKVGESAGPVMHATKAEANRFHDDKNSYTGVHAHGGPSTIDDSHNIKDNLRN